MSEERHWNYRVIEHEIAEKKFHQIHEVHYLDGKPQAYAVVASHVEAFQEDDEDLHEMLIWVLGKMKEAVDKPVLLESAFGGVR